MQSIQAIAIVLNRQKVGAQKIASQLSAIATASGIDVKMTDQHPLEDDYLKDIDTVCVIGGDGTLLGIVPQAVRYGVKVLGVNLGKLGFLVTYSPEAILRFFTDILEGEYELERRSLLIARSPQNKERVCLNDIVIKQMQGNRMMTLEVLADDQSVNQYDCDGLIFSTPTGSTAYNLSAGGPILHPRISGISMTPICPHTLSNRTVLFPHDIKLTVNIENEDGSPQVTMDGQSCFTETSPFPLSVHIPEESLQLIHNKGYSHFETIRTKLGWRERSI